MYRVAVILIVSLILLLSFSRRKTEAGSGEDGVVFSRIAIDGKYFYDEKSEQRSGPFGQLYRPDNFDLKGQTGIGNDWG